MLLLLSATDGRETLVDLTRTLADMAQSNKIRALDITTELVDAEICEVTMQPSVGGGGGGGGGALKPEPDLLLTFGECLVLDGFPPWQIRLTEIFCAGGEVGYGGFLRGLYHYAGAQMRFGR